MPGCTLREDFLHLEHSPAYWFEAARNFRNQSPGYLLKGPQTLLPRYFGVLTSAQTAPTMTAAGETLPAGRSSSLQLWQVIPPLPANGD